MTGILKGWVMISLSLSKGWTASGEHRRGVGVGDGVSVRIGVDVRVGARVGETVNVAEGWIVEGRGVGVGAAEQETTSVRINATMRTLLFVQRFSNREAR